MHRWTSFFKGGICVVVEYSTHACYVVVAKVMRYIPLMVEDISVTFNANNNLVLFHIHT